MARITRTKRRLRVRSGKLVSANQLNHLSLRPARLPAKVGGTSDCLAEIGWRGSARPGSGRGWPRLRPKWTVSAPVASLLLLPGAHGPFLWRRERPPRPRW